MCVKNKNLANYVKYIQETYSRDIPNY